MATAAAATDSSHVFVLVTANTCGHCVKFKNSSWSELQQWLQSESYRTIEYAVPTPAGGLTRHHPSAPYHIRNRITFYPTLMFVNGHSWNRAIAEPDSDIPLLAEVYGAELGGQGKYIPVKAPQLGFQTVKEWIQTCRTKSSFSSATSVPPPESSAIRQQQSSVSKNPAAANAPNVSAAGATRANSVPAPVPPPPKAQLGAPASAPPHSSIRLTPSNSAQQGSGADVCRYSYFVKRS